MQPSSFQFFLAIAAALVASAAAVPQQYKPAPAPAPYKEPAYAPAQYAFDWAVNDEYSGNNYGQQEERNGDQTSGSYYVALPDGRTQKVTYSVDAYGGYQAEVTYEGEAQYPPAAAPAPYKAAPAPAPAPAPYKPAPAPAPAPAPYKPATYYKY